jgi:DNA invertase Pin-like site-specific DNA recombinase
VSTERQAERGAARERQALAAACRRRGWQLLEPGEEAARAAHERNAPGLEEALRLLARGEENALVAARRERLDRALLELAALLASAQGRGWALVALDCAGQTTTAAGAASGSVLASFARCERRSISERTRAALARTRRASGSAGPRRCPSTRSSGSGASGRPAAAWPRSRTG